MNVQTQRIDNHKAQFTVEIEAAQLDEAKQKAAKRLAQRVRIKGFRKGKAPYRIIAQYVGEAAILEEAVELLGNDIYKVALDESEVEPYGPGSLDDFKIDPAPTFIFSVPLQPEVDLKSYADVRLNFEIPEVTDKDVDNALEALRRQEAELLDEDVEEVSAGNRVTIDIHSEFVDGEEPDDDDDDSTEPAEADNENDEDTNEETDDDTTYIPKKGDQFVHRHDLTLVLDQEKEPILPGFIAGLVGTKLDEEVQFELTIPTDDEDYDKNIAGRKVNFHVTIKKIEAIALPTIDDDFARKVTEADGDEPLDLEGLRQRTREDIEKDALQKARSEYGDKVLEKIIEGAEIAFPEMMLEERIDDMLRDLDNNLRQQSMNLDMYMRITGTTKESLQAQYHDSAVDSLKRTLVLRELLTAQNIEIGDALIEKRIDAMMMQFGAQGAQFRSLIDTPQMRENLLNELLMDNIMTRLVAIGRGEDPDIAVKEREAEVEAENEKARQRIEKMMADQATAQQEAEQMLEDEVATEELQDESDEESDVTDEMPDAENVADESDNKDNEDD